jgi:hypothetical protein
MSERAIAAELSRRGLGPISGPAVHYALRRVEARALAELTGRAASEKVRQLAALGQVMDEAWRAWERSKGSVTRVSRPREPHGISSVRERAERLPDPRYLEQVRAALAERRKLLGMDLPPDPEEWVSGPDMSPEVARAVEEAAEAEYRALCGGPEPDDPPEETHSHDWPLSG